jgi:hypothetical protein
MLFAACFGLCIHIQLCELLLALYLYQAFLAISHSMNPYGQDLPFFT